VEFNLGSSFSQIISALSQIIALENQQRIYHSWRVAIVATEIARKINPEAASQVFYAGLLHDVGTINLDEGLLQSLPPGQQLLHPQLREHPLKGARIVEEIPGMDLAANIIMDHHERWDGQGYPHGKRCEEINDGAQCLRVADAFDLCLQTNPRNDQDAIIKLLAEQKNREFSPSVFEVFCEVISHNIYCQEIHRDECLAETILEVQNSLPVLELKTGSDVIGITLRVFARVIDAKHCYTSGHSQRVSQYSILLAENLGLSHDAVSQIKWASLLHDAGKVAIPQYILNKPGALTPEEFLIVKKHPELTAEIIKFIDVFRDLLLIVRHHHEHFDGDGYPDCLKNTNIPLLARIITVADAFDAMTSPRPYQKMKSIKEALSELEAQKGRQFDGEIINKAQEIFFALTV